MPDHVWEGPRRKFDQFNKKNELVQIGWWLEPEREFVPITVNEVHITGSASPVYCEVGD